MNHVLQASSQRLLCTDSRSAPVSEGVGERRPKAVSVGFGAGAAERSYHLVAGGSRKFQKKLRPMATTAGQDGQNLKLAQRSVQFLSEQGLKDIPAAYVRAPEERSNLSESDAVGIPLIDLATAGPAEIGKACDEWGIMQVVNHGVPLELMEHAREVFKQFFAKPMEEKLAYTGTKESMMQGYSFRFGDGMQDWRDFFLHHTLPLSRRKPDCWPSEPADYRRTVLEFSNETIRLKRKILGLMSQSLGLEPSFLQDALGEPN